MSNTPRQIFIERRPDGSYAVLAPPDKKAKKILPTQAEAAAWAHKHYPGVAVVGDRVRNVATGGRDKWRSL